MQETNSREVLVAGLPVICRELTVLQMRNWLEGLGSEAPDPISASLFRECTFDELKRMTDLNDEKINALRPSQVEQVIKVCKELNPHFFVMLGRVADVPHAKH
jgi:hypothetical protein